MKTGIIIVAAMAAVAVTALALYLLNHYKIGLKDWKPITAIWALAMLLIVGGAWGLWLVLGGGR